MEPIYMTELCVLSIVHTTLISDTINYVGDLVTRGDYIMVILVTGLFQQVWQGEALPASGGQIHKQISRLCFHTL